MYFPSLRLALLVIGATAPSLTSAWPTAILDAADHEPNVLKRAEEAIKAFEARQGSAGVATSIFEPVPIFDPNSQYVDVSPGSGHEYVPPGPNDLRGPCPGLNALANHNFLPHNGYATVTQYISVCMTVIGMGPKLALYLSTIAGALSGDILSWSIGGKPSLLQSSATGILGNGLIGSHNKYEADASPTRPDLYQAGNNFKTVTSQFQALVNAAGGKEVTMDTLVKFRSQRMDEQIATNAYYFSGPFSGILVQPAAYQFIFRLMANHSAERPEGVLTIDTLKTWFGIEGENGRFRAVQGGERIPQGWYRRPISYPYESEYFFADVTNAAALYPKFLEIGGNVGVPNSFVGIDVADLTGGLYRSFDLLEGNNLGCFLYQLSSVARPDMLLGALTGLTDIIGRLVGSLSCPKLKAIDESKLKQFPGYSRQAVYN